MFWGLLVYRLFFVALWIMLIRSVCSRASCSSAMRPLGPHVSPVLCERCLTRFTRCKGFVLFGFFGCVAFCLCFVVWSGSLVQPLLSLHTHTHSQTDRRAHRHRHTHTHTYTHIHTWTHAHTHTHTGARHIHTHTHVHQQTDLHIQYTGDNVDL